MNNFKKLPTSARKAMILEDLLSLLVIAAVLAIIHLILSAFSLPVIIYKIEFVILILIALYLVIDTLAEVTIGYQYYQYLISEDRIVLESGYFSKNIEIIPMRRLQKITVKSNPVNRLFQLSNVDIITSGSTLTIKHLPYNEAEALADYLKDTINNMIASGVVSRG